MRGDASSVMLLRGDRLAVITVMVFHLTVGPTDPRILKGDASSVMILRGDRFAVITVVVFHLSDGEIGGHE